MKKEKYYYYDSKLMTKTAIKQWELFKESVKRLGLSEVTWIELVDGELTIFSKCEHDGKTLETQGSNFYDVYKEYETFYREFIK